MMGPLGVRALVWRGSARSRSALKSPSRRDFSWDDRVVWAKCWNEGSFHECQPLKFVDPFFEREPLALNIREGHGCGIWVARSVQTAMGYTTSGDSSVITLVEGLGKIIFPYTGVFRASGVQIIGIVDTRADYFDRYSLIAAARQMGVEIIPWEITKTMIENLWDKYMSMYIEKGEGDVESNEH